METDNVVRKEEATSPRVIATSGRGWAFAALVLILLLAAWLAYLGHPNWAGTIAVLDVVGIITAFTNSGAKGKGAEPE